LTLFLYENIFISGAEAGGKDPRNIARSGRFLATTGKSQLLQLLFDTPGTVGTTHRIWHSIAHRPECVGKSVVWWKCDGSV